MRGALLTRRADERDAAALEGKPILQRQPFHTRSEGGATRLARLRRDHLHVATGHAYPFQERRLMPQTNDIACQQDLPRLTAPEMEVYGDLRFDRLRPRLRLEQERVGFGWLKQRLRGFPGP